MDEEQPKLAVRTVLLCVAATLFTGGLALWLLLGHRFDKPAVAAAAFGPPPILSVAAAQQQLDFPIDVPRSMPDGYRLIGVRVFQVRSSIAPAMTWKFGAKHVTQSGYGVMVDPQNQSYRVVGIPGSAAAAQGLPTDRLNQLIAVNGRNVAGTQTAVVLKWLRSSPPLQLSIINADGGPDKFTINKRGRFILGGAMAVRPPGALLPPPNIPTDKRAALIFHSPNERMDAAILESKATLGSAPLMKYSGGSRSVGIDGVDVTFYGPPDRPGAHFVRGGLDFDVLNQVTSLSKEDVGRIVQSL